MNQKLSRKLRQLAKEETPTEQPVKDIVVTKNMATVTTVTYPKRKANYKAKKRAYGQLNHIQRGAYNHS